MTLGHQPTICLGRPLTPESSLILSGKIPASAIGTNSNALPINTLTGLQFFPLKQMDSPMLKLLTGAWIDELRDLTERVGLILPSMSCRGTSPCRSPLLACSDNDIKIQLMLIDILCQILEVKSIIEVQQWLLTAGKREKDHIVSLLSNALAKQPPQLSANEVSAQEKRTGKQVPSATKMSTLNEEETQACRDPSPEALNEGRTVTWGSQSPSRPKSRLSRPQSRLSSPAVCHLQSPQRPVLRYTKRTVTPQVPPAGRSFQEQWCNYSQQSHTT
ncbi:uncharacterized protein LOC122128624 [Clupea harengus]|uniref:Uncharacterized protein LOC122128624 n=1 Tax=Clupea harengus TaxID=7950 RepID=A0A8M1K526_CLUHA|nr:uncharacterized protein LOC122128624 [Clupea harengus]